MFIVAEVGSNWATLEDCKLSISHAKSIGADACKFQLFSSEELYGSDIRPLSTSLPREWIPILAERAVNYGIEFMCTPFSVDGLKFLDPYVKRHKIASSDLCHTDMLLASKATGKPLILSTGGHSLTDVKYALQVLGGYRELTLLYCESSYPAFHTDLRKFDLLKGLGCSVGLSDHSREVYLSPVGAKERGCVVLEKHANLVGATGPDAPHSLNLTEFREMVEAIRNPTALVNLQSPYEVDMLTMHNRRCIVKADIKKGERLEYNKNFGLYRSTKHDSVGLHPALAQAMHGKIALYDHKKGDAVGPKSAE